MKHILIVAGEASGDLHASNLVRAIKNTGYRMQDSLSRSLRSSELKFSGLGGEKMQSAGVELLTPFTKNAGTGLDPLLKITHFSQVFRKLVSYASKTKPDLAILVDFPDFNLRLAPRLKALGIKVVYYISPQIWAWRQSRVKIIQKYVDKMIVIFGFEKEFYNRFNVAAEFVGHPLLDVMDSRRSLPRENLDSRFRGNDKGSEAGMTERDGNDMRNDARRALGLDKDDLVIGLLPGSRPSEFRKHFPIMQKAIQLLSKTTAKDVIARSNDTLCRDDEAIPVNRDCVVYPEPINEIASPTARRVTQWAARNDKARYNNIKYILGAAPDITPEIINKMAKRDIPEILPYYNKTHEVLAASDILITVSGTITVEAALFQTPMIVIYKVPLLTELVFRPLIKTPFYAMVNIIAGKKVVPELIQQDCTPAKIAESVSELLNKDTRARMQEELAKVKAKLGSAGASQRAAEIIHKMLNP